MARDEELALNPWKCDGCGRTFKNARSFGSHKRWCPGKLLDSLKEFRCAQCGKLFKSKRALGGHRQWCKKVKREAEEIAAEHGRERKPKLDLSTHARFCPQCGYPVHLVEAAAEIYLQTQE